MPRKVAPDGLHYLTVHDGIWRVSMGVPRELRERLGTRLVRSTGTKSKAAAKLARDKIVAEFKKRIADAWAERGGKRGSLLFEALEFRRALEDAATPEERANVIDLLNERTREILDAGATSVRVEADDEGPAMEIPAIAPEAREEASLLNRVAGGKATPIALHHPRYIESLKIKERSKLDEPRALAILLDWLRVQHPPIKPEIEKITKRVAIEFADWLDASTDLSWASKAKYFGRLKFYWAWLVRRQVAKENPFADLTIQKPETARADDERPYTDAEVQKLLMGSPMEGDRMRDVMLVAALTGARLDAVIDLKVGNLKDGYFSFKAQKKERDGRDVPVHPDLAEVVARRIAGKAPDDNLFPEWPAPPKTSVKPRSSYFSKRYTKYTSDIGVREEVEGHRRSKVNFHSWRRWFITKLERARVREPLIAAIVGHKRPGMTLGLYSDGPEFEEAREAIALVRLPPLDGSPVQEERSLMPRRR